MHIEQIYTGCLAQGAYYIRSGNEAAVIDPLREVAPYLERAAKDGVRIRYVLETHFHADFVSGHLDLARQSGAEIIYGPMAAPDFAARILDDGAVLSLGDSSIRVLHTPGHTLESCCYLLSDQQGQPVALFSGDTLFIGDVGRPDLAQHLSPELTQERLAAYLYDSLREKILPLPDDLIVYPGHGAGSACGKQMSRETTDTLGHQKAVNYALQPQDRDTFIARVTNGLLPPPAYFPANVLMNKRGYEPIAKVLDRGLQALDPLAFALMARETGALILDTRDAEDFAAGFIPGSVHIGLDGSFAPWVGALLPDIGRELLLVATPGREEEVVTRLARVGFDHAIGYLEGGFAAWAAAGRETDYIASIPPRVLAERLQADPALPLLDVRRPSEFAAAHLPGASLLPLEDIHALPPGCPDPEQPAYVYCAGGYRSVIFCALLRARGYRKLVNISGGLKAIKDAGLFHLNAL